MAFDIVEELEHLIVLLEKSGHAYAVCGGLALAIHGHPRATMDIDLLIAPEDADAIVALARTAGFDIPGRKMVFGPRTYTPREVRRVSKIVPDTGSLLSLGLLLVGPGYEEVWSTRITRPWRGSTISIVSRQGLATMKRLAGRPQDLVDLAKLEGAHDDEEG